MIPDPKLNIWEHSEGLKDLCRKRARNALPEMDSAAQAADILKTLNITPKTPILDGGCGAGHFIHSLAKRELDLDYHGLDYSPSYIEIGKEAFTELSLDPERLFVESLDDLSGIEYGVAVLINVMSFNPDFRRILGRVVETGAKTILVRDNFGQDTAILWDIDGYLDVG
ncbi:MAG: class I SAM-dependent methyltransferase, partial [Deltaproteobacteria bacterium]|nr:class I SAM-dependent methyltransferase [Deltaproteobacteria bacterium]